MSDFARTLPSEDLRWRVAGHRDAKLFWDSGRTTLANLTRMLAIDGNTFADYPRALEFGCGCGRILLHMESTAATSMVYATDIDGWKGGPFPDFYHSAFHAPWYVFKHGTTYFAIKAYVPRGSLGLSDYILLERRAGPSPAVQPLWDGEPPAAPAEELPATSPPPLELPPIRKASIARRIVRRVRKYLGGPAHRR